MARILPILSSIKQENMRWVFATAIGQFCEAAVNYLANIEKAQDKNITFATFSSEVFPAFEIFQSNWLNSNEQKVRLATVAAMGSICQILPKGNIQNNNFICWI